MKKSRFLIYLISIFLFVLNSISAEKPNVIFILADDLGWSDLACYGSELYETPNIDRLAQEGVKFTNAYSACQVCSPTRASFLTGKSPAALKLTDWLAGRPDYDFQRMIKPKIRQGLPTSEKTIAEYFKEQGYQTAMFGKWHVGKKSPFKPVDSGFDLHIPKTSTGGAPTGGYHGPFPFKDVPGKKGDYLTDKLTDHAIKFINKNKNKPFFLYFPHFAVHDPIQGRADLVKKYKKKLKSMPKPSGPAFILEGNPDDKEPLTRHQLTELLGRSEYKGHKVFPQRIVKIKQHQNNPEFAAMVEAMDESLGRIEAELKSLGLSENTIIIFTADNGSMAAANFFNPKRTVTKKTLDKAYSSSNLPLRGAKGWMYEGGIRVPAIVKWPGKGKNGIICDSPIITADFYPTILEMAGLPLLPEQHTGGVSFTKALKGEEYDRGKPLYWHYPHYSNHGMQSPGGAIRLGDHKLLEYFENGTLQLFNLKEDIGEQNDISKQFPELVSKMHQMLKDWRQKNDVQMPVYR